MISGIIKVEVSVTETLIIPDITKTESNNCFIIHCFEENNDERIIAAITVYFQTHHALRAQPTDYSVTCSYRLVNNL